MIVAEINPKLKGWYQYFRYSLCSVLRTIDGLRHYSAWKMPKRNGFNPKRVTTEWRAGCGETAFPVWREGGANIPPTPTHSVHIVFCYLCHIYLEDNS